MAPAGTVRVGVVSTYPPRACGIGTFSRDLREALLLADSVSAVDLVAIVRDDDVDQAQAARDRQRAARDRDDPDPHDPDAALDGT